MITVNIVETKIEIFDHPRLSVFKVSVGTDKTVWNEVFASKEMLDTFVRGVKAGAAASGEFNVKVEHTTE